MLKRFCLLMFSFLLSLNSFSQETISWPSPEVEQMYKQAREYLTKGAVQQSVILLKQAIQLAPDVLPLHRDLANALNLTGNFKESYETIAPVIKNNQADEQTYQIAATALQGMKEKKKAKSTLENGLRAFPQSGMLYHEMGKYYESGNDMDNALQSWLQGIEKAPAYHLNYYAAAQTYFNTSRPLWTILYGEMFVNMERHTHRSLELRKQILKAYQKVFSNISPAEVPKYGSTSAAAESDNFEKAVLQTLMQLSPVVSDGFTTDNLTMLRTRFIMDWTTNGFMQKYPFTLFTYHDRLIRDGEFEAYHQWLFGKVENEKLYEAWTKFHAETMPYFESWAKSNKYTPSATDFYNTGDLKTLFQKKK